MKKRKGWIIILVIFLVAFGYNFKWVAEQTLVDFTNGNFEKERALEYADLTEEEKKEYSLEEFTQYAKKIVLTFSVVVTTFIALFLTIIRYFFLWIIIFGIYFGNIKYHKKKLTKNDFIKNKEYYRDVLKQYSVDVLSYIDNFKLSYPDVLIALLLQLKLKNIITIENNNIYINDSINLDNLSNSEKCCINNIRDTKLIVSNIYKYEYEQLIIKEGISKGLLVKKDTTKKQVLKEFAPSISIYLLVIIGYILYWNSNLASAGFNLGGSNYIIIMVAIFIFMSIVFIPPIFIIFYPFYLGVKINTYYTNLKINPYFRTKKAEEINKKLEGLKCFLNDFSILDEREAKEIVLWDEYLIYSIIFGHNTKVLENYKDIIIN